jgi:hypothetical protein
MGAEGGRFGVLSCMRLVSVIYLILFLNQSLSLPAAERRCLTFARH